MLRYFSLPFPLKERTSKNQVKDWGVKILSAAILDTNMKRESDSSAFIVRFLRDKHVDLSDNMDSLNDGIDIDTQRTEREIQDAVMQDLPPLDNPIVDDQATNVESR